LSNNLCPDNLADVRDYSFISIIPYIAHFHDASDGEGLEPLIYLCGEGGAILSPHSLQPFSLYNRGSNQKPKMNRDKIKKYRKMSEEEMLAFEKNTMITCFEYLKERGFPSDQGEYFKLLDAFGLNDENLHPLGMEVAGKNLVLLKGETILA
jgi:hypothetical protein